MSHIRRDVPLAIVSNFAEAHRDFLNRSPAPANGGAPLATQEAYHADRTLLWAGDPKLVIVSYPALCTNYLFELLGYARTSRRTAEPKRLPRPRYPERQALLRWLIAHPGPDKMLSRLCCDARILCAGGGLTPRTRASRAHRNTATPCHLAARLHRHQDQHKPPKPAGGCPTCGDLLPEAHFCHDLAQAARIVRWFTLEGRRASQTGHGKAASGSVVVEPGTSPLPRNRRRSPCSSKQPYWGAT